jgi:cation:H+ antiporter
VNPLDLALLAVGLALLIAGAELLVRGGSSLASALGVSPLVIGLTVVAFGTSAPELATSLMASARGEAGLAIGNVVGSNIFNVLVILGLSAAITPLAVARQLVRVDVPLMALVSAAVWVMAANGTVARWEGGLLVAGIVVYTVVSVRRSRSATHELQSEFRDELCITASKGRWLRDVVLVGVGLVLLVLGSRWLVLGAQSLARMLGVTELVIGLTIVAGGTSLPELATSAVAAFRRHTDIAVGNVVGSNLFNMLSVLGASALAAGGGLRTSGQPLAFDLPVMVVVAVACLPVFLSGRQVARWEGVLFLAAYAGYLVWMVVIARSGSLPPAVAVTVAFGLPLIGLTSLPLLARGRRR